MKILILDENYPHEANLYGDVFVHVRAKEYVAQGHDVLVLDFFKAPRSYVYEGIQVQSIQTPEEAELYYKEYRPDIVVVHFFHRHLMPLIAQANVPCFIWVHGYEALGWYRRLFNLKLRELRHLPRAIFQNVVQQIHFRKLTQTAGITEKTLFVFPSMWLKKIVSTDALTRIEHFQIIPNPIDTKQFPYEQKAQDHLRKILSIRPYTTRKYANDVSVKFILALKEKPYFHDLRFALYGDGPLFDRTVLPLRNLGNVALRKRFVPHDEIRAIHREFGIFLCPTRQDAQGVSMCEAMSSGLVPLTSNNTAIPEFVEHGITGLLSRSVGEMVRQYDDLLNEPKRYFEMSAHAGACIRSVCDLKKIAEIELGLFNRRASS